MDNATIPASKARKGSNVNIADPSQISSAQQRMAPAQRMIRTLLQGTQAMRAAGTEYTPRHPNESDQAYVDRIGMTTLFNATEDAIDNAVARVFDETCRFAEDASVTLAEWEIDIDLQGNNLHDFARTAMRHALADGLVHILVDHPKVDSEIIDQNGNKRKATMRDMLESGVRPYLTLVTSENLIAAYTKRVNSETIYYHVRIRETEIELDGFNEVEVERIRVLTPGAWQLWERTEQDDGKGNQLSTWGIVDQGVMSRADGTLWDRVPMFTFYAGRKIGDVEAKPPFLDLAYKNIEHWQSSSDQRNILSQARFPMLAVSGFEGPLQMPDDGSGNPVSRFIVGPRTVLTTGDPSGRWYYVEPQGNAIKAGESDLKSLEEQMSVLGIEPLMPRSGGSMTATENSIDESKARAPLEEWARGLKSTLENACNHALEWIGEPPGAIVEINTEVGLSITNAQEIQALIQLRIAGDISRWTLYTELQRRGVLGPNFNPRAEALRIDLENPDAPDVPDGETDDAEHNEETDGVIKTMRPTADDKKLIENQKQEPPRSKAKSGERTIQ